MARGYRAAARAAGGDARTLGVLAGARSRCRRRWRRWARPSARVPAVHIAGTNGKGSTAAMTESILRAGRAAHGPVHLAAPRPLHRAHPDRRPGGRRRAAGRAGRARVAATGVPLTYFEVADRAGLPGHGRGRGGRGGAGGGPGRAARRHQRLPRRWPPPSPASASTTPSCWATRWRPSPARRRASPSPACRCSWGRCRRRPRRRSRGWRRRWGRRWRPAGRRDPAPAPVAPALAGPHQRRNAALAVALARAAAAGAGRRAARRRRSRAGLAAGGLARAARAGGARRAARRRPQPGGRPRRCWRRCPPQRPRALVLSIVRGKPAAEMLARWRPRFDRPGAHPLAQPPRAAARPSWPRCCPPGAPGRRCRCRPTPWPALAAGPRAGWRPGAWWWWPGRCSWWVRFARTCWASRSIPSPTGDPMP